MTAAEESQVIARLGQLEEAIARRFTELDNKLSSALLEQERRNSTFATRDRLDELARKVDALNSIQETQRAQGAAITHLSNQISTRALDHLKATLGILASFLAMLLTALVTWLLTHGVH